MRFHVSAAVLLSLLALLGAGCASAPTNPAADPDWQMPDSWTAPQEPVRIAALSATSELYYVGSAELAAYLITTPEGHILIDAPLAANVDRVTANIEAVGADPADVEILLASHAHFDHVAGLGELQRRTGAEVRLSAADAAQIARGGKGDFFLEDDAPFEPVVADRILEDGEVVRLGDAELTALLTPGHTRGCTSWKIRVGEGADAKTAVMICSLSVLDGMRLWKDPHYEGLGADFCGSVAKLEGIDADYFLASHASFFGLRPKAERLAEEPDVFIDPEGYRRYLAGARQRIEDTLKAEGLEEGCGGL